MIRDLHSLPPSSIPSFPTGSMILAVVFPYTTEYFNRENPAARV